MAYDDGDSDNAYNDRRAMRGMSSSAYKGSILKNSSIKKNSQYSDDDDDDDNYNSGRLSNRNRNESPLQSHRSVSSKPPSGRLQPLGSSKYDQKEDYTSYSSTKKSSYNEDAPIKSSGSKLPAITYTPANKNNMNDSDDSMNDRYNKLTRKTSYDNFDNNSKSKTSNDREADIYNSKSLSSKYDPKNKFDSKFDSKYDSKFESKYDTYDEDDKKESNRFYRSESLLKKSDKLSSLSNNNNANDDDFYANKNLLSINTKTNRSNSLDRLKSDMDISYNNVSNKLQKSFLVGSLSALNGKGLLSNEEIDRNLVDRKARVLIVTWNMGEIKKLPENMDDLILPDNIQTMPDIFVIGVQEFQLNTKEWEISLQEKIGPSHVKLASHYHGSVGVNLFIRRELIWFSSIVEFEHVSLRGVNAPGRTKASIVISFQLFGTLMCFICSHFIAGEGNLDQRIENYKQTITNMKLPKQLAKKKAIAADSTDNFDVVFWFGDLNFLVTKERDKVEKKVTHLRTKRGINYEEITNHDELKQIMAEERGFKQFDEGRITFEPTYKFDLNSDEYDTSEKCRIPSYCDRILYRCRQRGAIACSYYDSIRQIKLSDHRPVYGLFEVAIRPGVDKVPLSYGDFDRQIYAAGYQKRQMFRACDVGFESTKKSPCLIQ